MFCYLFFIHWTNRFIKLQEVQGPFFLLITGSSSTFEFPSRVNLSGPSLYCIARTLSKWSRHSIGLAGATRLTRSDFVLILLLLKGQRFVSCSTLYLHMYMYIVFTYVYVHCIYICICTLYLHMCMYSVFTYVFVHCIYIYVCTVNCEYKKHLASM